MTPSQFVHELWRLLPVRQRRSAYAWLSAAVAPRPDVSAPAKAGPPWIVAGVLRSPSGLGQTARLALSSLRDHGPGAAAIDLTSALMQPASLPEIEGPACPDGGGTILLYVTPPNIPRALAAIGRKRLKGKRVVAVWVWELERLPDAWVEQARFVHEIAAPTHFAAEAIARSTGRQVRRLRYPLALEPRLERRQPHGPFKIGFAFDIASTEARKNPWDLIQAFEEAFGPEDDVLLSIKTRSADYDRQAWGLLQSRISEMGPRAELFCEDWSRERTLEWLASLDLYASLHRSEGFGLTLAEAMHQGVPVLATDWSATSEFVDREVGFPVPYVLVPVEDRQQRHTVEQGRWAQPDVTAAAKILRKCYAGRANLASIGLAGRRRIEDEFTAAGFISDLGVLSGTPIRATD
jgi:glycosyltransferase involved in cell wall biosynthesis